MKLILGLLFKELRMVKKKNCFAALPMQRYNLLPTPVTFQGLELNPAAFTKTPMEPLSLAVASLSKGSSPYESYRPAHLRSVFVLSLDK